MGVLKDQTLKKYVAAIAAVWTSGVELGEGVVSIGCLGPCLGPY